MKAITLKQPWASLVASGLKQVENRTWAVPRSIRGERIAIHAGKGFDPDGLEAALFNACCCGSPIYHCLACDLFEALDPHKEDSKLVASRILCTARVVGQIHPQNPTYDPEWFVDAPCRQCNGEGRYGDWTGQDDCEDCFATGNEYGWFDPMFYDGLPGVYGWILADIELVSDPTIYRGKLGIWELPADALKEAA